MEPLKNGTNLDELTASGWYSVPSASESPQLPAPVEAGMIYGSQDDTGFQLEWVHPRFIASTRVALDGTITKSPYVSLD